VNSIVDSSINVYATLKSLGSATSATTQLFQYQRYTLVLSKEDQLLHQPFLRTIAPAIAPFSQDNRSCHITPSQDIRTYHITLLSRQSLLPLRLSLSCVTTFLPTLQSWDLEKEKGSLHQVAQLLLSDFALATFHKLDELHPAYHHSQRSQRSQRRLPPPPTPMASHRRNGRTL
jgi:hypothetical protein